MVKTGQAWAGQFCVVSSTGAAVAADSTPTGTLIIDGVDDAASVTITTPNTGTYKWAVTLPTLAAGQLVQIRIAATVATIAAKGIVASSMADTVRESDTYAKVDTEVADIQARIPATLAADGSIKASLQSILGTAFTEGASGRIAANLKTFFNVASATGTQDLTPATTSVANRVTANTDQIEGTDATDALTAAAEAALVSTDTTAGAIAADVTTLLGRLSAARAGYLDNLSAGAVATAAAMASVASSVGLTATAAKLLRYIQLTLRKDSAVATDLATELGEINANTGTGTGGYLSTTDSQEASRDAISAGSASAADIAAELGGMGYTVVDADSVSATAISKRRGDLWTVAFTDLGALGTWTKLWFTIKTGDTGDADTDAKVQILLTNPTVGTDGLQRLNGAAGTAAQGSIVVDDSATGDITVTVASAATTQLAVRSDYVFDVQILRAAGTTTMAYGTFTVRSDVTRAVA